MCDKFRCQIYTWHSVLGWLVDRYGRRVHSSLVRPALHLFHHESKQVDKINNNKRTRTVNELIHILYSCFCFCMECRICCAFLLFFVLFCFWFSQNLKLPRVYICLVTRDSLTNINQQMNRKYSNCFFLFGLGSDHLLEFFAFICAFRLPFDLRSWLSHYIQWRTWEWRFWLLI